MLKYIKKINIALIVLLALCAGFSVVCAQGGTYVANRDYVLDKGRVLSNDLYLFGGNAELCEGSRVDGDVLIFGGNVVIDGTVNGNVTAFDGSVKLGPVSVVNGDVTCLEGDLVQADSSVITGDRLTRWTDGDADSMAMSAYAGSLGSAASHVLLSLTSFTVMVIRVLLFLLLALLISVVMPKQLKKNSAKLRALPWQSLLIGFLCVVFFVGLELALCVTLVLIPLALLLLVAFWLFSLYGLIVVCHQLGARAADLLKLKWPTAAVTILGAAALRIVTFILVRLVPCLGGSVELIAEMFGIGAVVLTLTNWFNNKKAAKTAAESYQRSDPAAPIDDPVEEDDPVETVGTDQKE